ncbi:MAG: PQQ-binding-like beta-propeller repeat protein, partial [Thermoplasmata archaeon]
MTQVKELWNYKSGHAIYSVAISDNAEYVVTGNWDRSVNCFSRTGELLWNYITGGQTSCVAITPDGKYISATSTDKNAYCFRWKERLLGKYGIGETLWGTDISADGKKMVLGTDEGNLFCFDREAARLIWKFRAAKAIHGVSISHNSRYVAAGSADYHVYILDSGKVVWKYGCGGIIWSVSISGDGRFVVAGSEDTNVYFFERSNGRLKWKYSLPKPVWAVDISANGEFVVAGSEDGFVYCFNGNNGQLVWKYNAKASVCGVAISDTGTHIAACTNNEDVFCFENDILSSRREISEIEEIITEKEKEGYDVTIIKDLLGDARDSFSENKFDQAMLICSKIKEMINELPKAVEEDIQFQEVAKKIKAWVITLGVIDRNTAMDRVILRALLPIYTKHEELINDTKVEDQIAAYKSKIDMFQNILSNYERVIKANPIASAGISKVAEEVRKGKQALQNSLAQLEQLQKKKEQNIIELQDQVRILVVEWLTNSQWTKDSETILEEAERREKDISKQIAEILDSTTITFKGTVPIASASSSTPLAASISSQAVREDTKTENEKVSSGTSKAAIKDEKIGNSDSAASHSSTIELQSSKPVSGTRLQEQKVKDSGVSQEVTDVPEPSIPADRDEIEQSLDMAIRELEQGREDLDVMQEKIKDNQSNSSNPLSVNEDKGRFVMQIDDDEDN